MPHMVSPACTHEALCAAHRATDTKPHEAMAFVKAQEKECVADLSPPRDTDFALDAPIAVRFPSATD